MRGHACFEVREQNATIVFDPFRGIDISDSKAKADIVRAATATATTTTKPSLKKGGIVLEGFWANGDRRHSREGGASGYTISAFAFSFV